MAKRSTLFLKLEKAGRKTTRGGGSPLLLLLGLVIVALMIVKVRLDSFAEKQKEEGRIRKETLQKRIVKLEGLIDSIEIVNQSIAQSLSSVEKSTNRMNALSELKVDEHVSSEELQTLSNTFLLSYSDSLKHLLKEMAETIDTNPAILQQIPLIVPIKPGRAYSFERGFGMKKDPFTFKMAQHDGVDFNAYAGTEVVATAKGRVKTAEVHRFWGKRVIIAHGNGFKTVYAHLDEMRVESGDYVKKGDILGTVGESGLATGPHVHYEIHYDDSVINPENLLIDE